MAKCLGTLRCPRPAFGVGSMVFVWGGASISSFQDRKDILSTSGLFA